MKAYSTREVADLLGLSPGRVRSLVRAGIVTPQRDESGQPAFSFQDLVLLRTAKGLIDAKVPARRITKALRALASQLPTDRPLSAVRVQIDGDRVTVRDANSTWEPESGQTVLDFSVRELGEKVAPLARDTVQRALRHASSADDLFQAALESEQIGANEDAETAYRNVLAADPSHVAARINLGRLRHVAKALDDAERLYREALEIDPQHPTARFNLGVVLEDRGATTEAIEAYLEAVRIDPRVADVHFNLARLYQQAGNQQAALRHFARFKALTRDRPD
ncbi:MAG TPA: tetratricopeptide repeat protein [Gammaproteobacteria bacterium]|jgi:tetratricopeptide (TPR) repeat protein|nr:tetratricopeptide repeat protein [Gammaproteobacteria bacterium]